MRKLLFVFVLSSLLTSCATVFNAAYIEMQVVSSEPTKLVVKSDTLKETSSSKYIPIKRSREPLKLTFLAKDKQKTIFIQPKNSLAYWANIYFNYGIGMLIDKDNPKRYYFPKTIYIDMLDTLSFQKFIPPSPIDSTYKSIIKFTPLKLIGLGNPGIEVAYEKWTGKRFSTQLMASWLFPNSLLHAQNNATNAFGFRAAIEEKFYLRNNAPKGSYIGFEIDYLQNKYYDTDNFGTPNANLDSSGVNIYYNDTNFVDSYYSDTYGINKKNISFNIKWGHQIITKRFVFDYYIGLGLRYRNVSHFDRINPNDKWQPNRHFSFYRVFNKEGKYWTVSIPLNFKIGWVF
jgi:hypothetical protein